MPIFWAVLGVTDKDYKFILKTMCPERSDPNIKSGAG
jgi:hypothetical protein